VTFMCSYTVECRGGSTGGGPPHFGPASLDFHLNRPVISLTQLHIVLPSWNCAPISPPVPEPPLVECHSVKNTVPYKFTLTATGKCANYLMKCLCDKNTKIILFQFDNTNSKLYSCHNYYEITISHHTNK